MKTFSLQPIQAGVRTQIEVSRDILAAVRELEQIAKIAKPELQARIEAVAGDLMKASDRITGTATETVKFIRNVAA